MTSDLRLMDRFRAGLYALPITVFAILAFVVFMLLIFIVGIASRKWDPGFELSQQGNVVFTAIFGGAMAVGSTVGEHSRRKKFVGAQDRAAYHRAVDREVLPDSGIPMHWREQLLTEIADRSGSLFGAIVFAVAFGFVIAAMIVRGGEWPLVVAAIAAYGAVATILFLQVRRSKKVERMYAASSPRRMEGAQRRR